MQLLFKTLFLIKKWFLKSWISANCQVSSSLQEISSIKKIDHFNKCNRMQTSDTFALGDETQIFCDYKAKSLVQSINGHYDMLPRK